MKANYTTTYIAHVPGPGRRRTANRARHSPAYSLTHSLTYRAPNHVCEGLVVATDVIAGKVDASAGPPARRSRARELCRRRWFDPRRGGGYGDSQGSHGIIGNHRRGAATHAGATRADRRKRRRRPHRRRPRLARRPHEPAGPEARQPPPRRGHRLRSLGAVPATPRHLRRGQAPRRDGEPRADALRDP